MTFGCALAPALAIALEGFLIPAGVRADSLVGSSVAVREFHSSVRDLAVCGSSGCGRVVAEALANALAARGVSSRVLARSEKASADAVVEGEVLAADPGTRSGRFWSLDIAGGAKVSARGKVKDRTGRVVGEFAHEAEATGGKMGGESEELLGVAIRKVADHVADCVATGRY